MHFGRTICWNFPKDGGPRSLDSSLLLGVYGKKLWLRWISRTALMKCMDMHTVTHTFQHTHTHTHTHTLMCAQHSYNVKFVNTHTFMHACTYTRSYNMWCVCVCVLLCANTHFLCGSCSFKPGDCWESCREEVGALALRRVENSIFLPQQLQDGGAHWRDVTGRETEGDRSAIYTHFSSASIYNDSHL